MILYINTHVSTLPLPRLPVVSIYIYILGYSGSGLQDVNNLLDSMLRFLEHVEGIRHQLSFRRLMTMVMMV